MKRNIKIHKESPFFMSFIICSLIPLCIQQYPVLTTIFTITLFIYLFFLKKCNCSLIILLAVVSCIPAKLSENATGASIFTILNRFIMYGPIILAIYKGLLVEKDKLFKSYKILIILYCSLCLLWFVINNDPIELSLIPKYLLITSVLYLFFKTNIERNSFYSAFDAITIVYGTFILIEFFIRWNPYADFLQYGVDDLDDFVNVFRPNGLIGNALLSGEIFLFEICFICCKYIEKNEINYLLLGLTFLFSLATISKTPIVGGLILLLFTFFINSKSSRKLPVVPILIISIVTIIILSVSDVFISFFIERISDMESDVSTNFRIGAFDITYRVFLDNPFGVGISKLFKLIESQYANNSWINNFRTLDNVFLSQLSLYGVLSIIPLSILFKWMIYSYCQRNKASYLLRSMYVFFLMVLFISFTHDWEGYNISLVVIGAYAGLNLRLLSNNKKKDKI